MNRAQAEAYFRANNIPPNFGYGGVSDQFIIDKALLCKGLQNSDPDMDLWAVLGIECGGYDDQIDQDILKVLNILNTKQTYVTDLAKQMEVSATYIELIQYIICSAELAEYGSSPRGCWITEFGSFVLKSLNEKYEG